MKRKVWVLGLALLLLGGMIQPNAATAASPEGYHYDYWMRTTASPLPYEPETSIYGDLLGIGSFKSPEDLFVADNRNIYVLDTGNNRIIHLNDKWEVLGIIQQFQRDGQTDQLAEPQGMYVTEDGQLYVADTGNKRIVQFDADGQFVRLIAAPQSDVLSSSFQYVPRKVAVDSAGRVYVISQGTFDGIIEFTPDGEFSRFTGTNRVKFNFVDYIWKSISTKKQREQMVTFVPIEFYNLDLDEEDFIYTTTSEMNSKTPIQRLNPKGGDVLRRNGYGPPVGDFLVNMVGAINGSSIFTDIKVSEFGVYRGLDSKRGRIFSYDQDGNLLYIFGQLGSEAGSFKTPVAIDELGDKILILDRDRQKITVFRPTLFGETVNQAVMHQYVGDTEQASQSWNRVLELNANYELAYIGMGKAFYDQGNYEEAMRHFKLGNDRKHYSKAFSRYRKAFLKEHFGLIMYGFMAGTAGIITWRTLRKRQRRLAAHAK